MNLFEALEVVGLYLSYEQLAQVAGMLLETDALDGESDRKVCAIVEHFNDIGFDNIRAGRDYYGLPTYRIGDALYAVANDDEANAAWDNALDSYLDDCVEGANGPYFDRVAWKRDAHYDGRGHCLATYDGNEEEAREFFIYRIG